MERLFHEFPRANLALAPPPHPGPRHPPKRPGGHCKLDLNLSPSEEAFRQEVRGWIRQNLPPEWTVDRLEELKPEEAVACGRKWQERCGAAGWLGLAWPKQYGGRGATLMEQAIYVTEAIEARSPMAVDKIGLQLVGPGLIEVGTPEQKERFLGRIL